MRDDGAKYVPFDPPDADRVPRNYLEICRRPGLEPVSRERASSLTQEWT
jgi:hypothetical protein